MADKKQSVAFIGTGIMGAPIAGHILDAGYPVTVYNRTAAKAQPLLERGAVWAETAADAVRGADVVFTMVGYPEDVEELYLAGDGLLASSKPGAILIDLTTSSPSLARDIAGAAAVSERTAFDCPVTGGEAGAIAGTLTAIAGATERDIEPVRALLETFTSKIFCFGGAGKGQSAKLANQVSLAASMVGMADALSFAQQEGLDLAQTREMILTGTGATGVLASLAPKALDGDWKPGFKVRHFMKDLGLALAEAEERDIALPGCDVAFTLYDMLDAIGGAELGTQAITLLYQEEAEAVAAGLDWSLYTAEHEHEDGCGCGHDHGDGHECTCGHDHGDDHECCHGAGHHHEHGEGCCHGADGE
ncbi:NAD(P)-dependent oxidoreductase [Collinsella intestinalis]|uniref:NAD(P)-dependent oxidoreductase n=1 Tax=Collinsella intestinalis TaxID=147207 RepID=UPI00195EF651|nr:NAD(P)-dependent oxidoreductase [Collinsella intestinalis]MBM6943141.1 NAD(P)-dependent oxidoreductase [Collinsella intestinalis]HIU04653.1 NAD(P)-dependent oxidoreductase [Candidatus Coprousia avicola]